MRACGRVVAACLPVLTCVWLWVVWCAGGRAVAACLSVFWARTSLSCVAVGYWDVGVDRDPTNKPCSPWPHPPPIPNTTPTHPPKHSNAAWKPLAGLLWFASLIAWEILFGLCASALAMHVNPVLSELERRTGPEVDENEEYKNTHRLLGAILSFVIGFRVNNAYQLYYEGRRIVGSVINGIREIVLEAYTSLPKGIRKDKEIGGR